MALTSDTQIKILHAFLIYPSILYIIYILCTCNNYKLSPHSFYSSYCYFVLSHLLFKIPQTFNFKKRNQISIK
jgi:hypothetical protein